MLWKKRMMTRRRKRRTPLISQHNIRANDRPLS
jgi:hypothetical protein